MDFKLTRNYYLALKSIIWLVYFTYLIYSINSIIENEIIWGVAFCGILMQMTLIEFIDNWYKKLSPTLLDWFRLTTFYVLIFNFLKIAPLIQYHENIEGYTISLNFILPTLLCILIGLLALKLSEYIYATFLINKIVKPIIYHNYIIKNYPLLYILTLIVGFLQIYMLLNGIIGYGTMTESTTGKFSFFIQIVYILSNFFLLIYAIFKFKYSESSIVFKYFFYFFLAVQLIYGLLSGMKESIIVPCIIVFIPFISSGRKISKVYIYLFIITLTLIFPLNSNYRETLVRNPELKKDQALAVAFIKTFELNISENISQGGESFSDRLSLLPFLVYSIENEEKWTEYKNLNRYIYLPISWILPRDIMPSKPMSDTGAKLNEMIFGVSTNSLTPTTYGWAYFEGGFIYVFILFLIFGCFISYFEFILKFNTLFGMLIYISLIIDLLKVENDIYFYMSGELQRIFMYYIFYALLLKRVS
jgi:hypothetical protein